MEYRKYVEEREELFGGVIILIALNRPWETWGEQHHAVGCFSSAGSDKFVIADGKTELNIIKLCRV